MNLTHEVKSYEEETETNEKLRQGKQSRINETGIPSTIHGYLRRTTTTGFLRGETRLLRHDKRVEQAPEEANRGEGSGEN